jgi:putative NIF3 family GTP cyclohydrolase 1 type 2
MPTIQDIIDYTLSQVQNPQTENTVDTIKIGDPSAECTGMVSCFTVTMDVINLAIDKGANFIVTHEPTFYAHRDNITDDVDKSDVYHTKRKLLNENNITVWRFHDNWHRISPDGILTGMIQKLGWQSQLRYELKSLRDNPVICDMPKTRLGDLVDTLRDQFDLQYMRYMGDPDMPVSSIGLAVGAIGGEYQMGLLVNHNVDCIIVGETCEWMVGEYVRDAIDQGRTCSMIVLGHVMSEQEGMRYYKDWLKPVFKDLPMYYAELPELFSVR